VNRRNLLQMAACGIYSMLHTPKTSADASSTPPAPQAHPFEWEEATIAQLKAAMDNGKETAASLTQKYLQRIASIDKAGPALNAVIELNPDAIAIAESLDAERKSTGSRGPLHGIPIMLKDNIDTHDRMMTTAGSLALLGSFPHQDAFVMKKLRAAGAVIIAKTNLSEWANFRASPSTSGWSARGGLTRNPYALDRNPSGSSSGSAVAVSANLCAVAIGTETDGSIISPATLCGIVGLKPTVGLVSRSGIIPISHTQDTAGPMARTVTDAAILLGAIAGADANDPTTQPATDKIATDYTHFLKPDGLRGARIGVARQLFHTTARSAKVIDAALETMKRQGAVLIDPVEIPSHGKFDDAEYQILLYEFKAGLNAYLASLGKSAPIHSLQELIDFN
jgi:amidase